MKYLLTVIVMLSFCVVTNAQNTQDLEAFLSPNKPFQSP
jgi:hypothetical protein